MTVPPGYRRVDLPLERLNDALGLVEWGFAADMREDQRVLAHRAIDWTRVRGVEVSEGPSAGQAVAVHSSYASTMRTPGGAVACSGLTIVSVHPGHRRRGLLRSMIADHFARSRARGEHVSTLIAAETAIYQRYGYGLVSPALRLNLSRGLTLREIEGSEALDVRLETAQFELHGPIIQSVVARDPRPGAQIDPSEALLADPFTDPDSRRESKERQRILIVEDAGDPVAFALFQRELAWENAVPQGKVSVHGWSALTPAAARRMWSVLTNLDLMATTTVDAITPDDPLMFMAEDVRGLHGALVDQLWLRVLDVPGALTARTYAADLDAVIAVEDDMIPENAHPWHVSISDGRATVTRAERDAAVDLRMDVRVLSTIYLGGPSLTALAHAGMVAEVKPGAIDAVSRAFRGDMMPRSTFYF